MWHWHLMPILIVIILIPNFQSVQAASTSSGPTSDEESEVIWKEGRTAYQESRLQDAINSLQRLVDRYPGKPNRLEAQFLLGSTFARLKRPNQAIPLLKDYIETGKSEPHSIEAQILLGHCYLKTGKKDEGLLLALETEKTITNNRSPIEAQIRVELLKTEALFLKNQTNQAELALQAVEQNLSKTTPSTHLSATLQSVQNEVFELKLRMKASECTRQNRLERQSELQAKEQIDRRGLCLMETLPLYRQILLAQNKELSEDSTQTLVEAFKTFNQFCKKPTLPPDTKGNKKTRIENVRYQAELSDFLARSCKKTNSDASLLLNEWKKIIPKSSFNFTDLLIKILNKMGV